jgi:tetratricopeptide (TPR) repeat protein
MRQSESWQWQVFAIAVMGAITSHLVEGVTGIPVVSTLMMFWVTLGITVSAGMLAGLYPIGATSNAAQPPATAAAASDPAAGKGSNGGNGGKGRESKRGRRKQKREAAPTPARASTRSQTSPIAMVLYGFIFLLALFSVWWFNLSTIYADMRFHEGQAFSQGQGDYQQQLIGLDRYIAAITHNPREDYYYLSLGRSLMNVADQKRAQGQEVGTPEPEADVQDLTTLPEITAVTEFAQGHTPLELLSYAEAVLRRARELNPMNKDHYANLARLNNFWYNWTQEPERMNQTLAWYERANEVAPQDVTLLNEHARVAMQFAGIAANQGNDETWSELTERADRLLTRSAELDETYFDTTVQIAELTRVRGEIERSVDAYVEVIARDPGQVTPHIEVLLASYASEPEQIMRLYDAYMEKAAETNDPQLYSIAGIIAVRADNMEQAIEPYRMATELAPDTIDHRLNYSIVLSDTNQFSAALAEAETGLDLAISQEGQETAVGQFEYLISILQPKVAGGQ